MKAITLFDYISRHPRDYDIFDEDYDVEPITISWDEDAMNDPKEDYDRFISELLKKTYLTDECGEDYIIVAGWSCLIRRNEEKLREFAEKHWSITFPNRDKFIEEWIKDLRLYVSGYAPDHFYATLFQLTEQMK